jgi:hypothetical protein
MVRIESHRVALSAVCGAIGVLAMLTTAQAAMADPSPTTDPAQPVPVQAAPAQPGPAQAAPAQAGAAQALSGTPSPAPAAGVPHLPSPDNLPPGTTEDPTGPPQGHGLSYLRDLWHAVQTQDVSGGDALLLLTQRPMDANAMPTNGLPTGPQTAAPVDPAAPAPPAPPAPGPSAEAPAAPTP